MQKQEHIWSVPEVILEKLPNGRRNTDEAEFIFCGLYCIVSILSLLFFGGAALMRGETVYAYTIFSFAIATFTIYSLIWISGLLFLAKHFIVLLMAMLCLYLFYSGGTEGTGPIYFMVFPLVALFLQGLRIGLIAIVSLFLLTLLIFNLELFAFNPSQYSFAFISRIFSIYIIISVLSFLFSFFRKIAEGKLLLREEDLLQITNMDSLTGLATPHFTETILSIELNRFKRTQSLFCVMLIQVDQLNTLQKPIGREYKNYLLKNIAQLFLDLLRSHDIPCRWKNETFLILLPDSSLEQAHLLAERLRLSVENHEFTFNNRRDRITLSIGISEINVNVEETITRAEINLFEAVKNSGNKIVSQVQSQQHAFI